MKKNILWVVSMIMLAASGVASAALPTEIGTTLTALQTDGAALFALVIPIVGVFLGFTVLLKLFKRFTNKL